MVTKLKLSPLRKDVWVARVSGIFGVSGALIIAFANTPAVLIIGKYCSPQSFKYIYTIYYGIANQSLWQD